jgi:DeoR/GlpR family transcriptional regulator of sugar metabolism
VILADYSKIGQCSRIAFCPINRVDTLITNKKGAEGPALLSLRKKLPQVILA